MKNFFVLLTSATLLISCSTSDDSDTIPDQQIPEQISIVGVWTNIAEEVEYRCDNDAELGITRLPDIVDNIGDLEITVDGKYYILDDNGERQPDIEDFNGDYEVDGDIITYYYTVLGEPRSSTNRIFFTEPGDLDMQNPERCETHADEGIYYARRYQKVQ